MSFSGANPAQEQNLSFSISNRTHTSSFEFIDVKGSDIRLLIVEDFELAPDDVLVITDVTLDLKLTGNNTQMYAQSSFGVTSADGPLNIDVSNRSLVLDASPFVTSVLT